MKKMTAGKGAKMKTETKTAIQQELRDSTMIESGMDAAGVKKINCVTPSGKKFSVTSESIRPFLRLMAEQSKAELVANGFHQICSAVAGIDSGSSWFNDETLQGADIKVRNFNRITYKGDR